MLPHVLNKTHTAAIYFAFDDILLTRMTLVKTIMTMLKPYWSCLS